MTKIRDLRFRVALCTQRDVVVNGSTIELSRAAVAWTWACIEPAPARPSFISPAGYAILEAADRITHVVTVRAGLGLDVRSTAWVYEERRKSPPRWMKVVGFTEQDQWLVLQCHLVEASDNVQPPSGSLAPQPSDVKL